MVVGIYVHALLYAIEDWRRTTLLSVVLMNLKCSLYTELASFGYSISVLCAQMQSLVCSLVRWHAHSRRHHELVVVSGRHCQQTVAIGIQSVSVLLI